MTTLNIRHILICAEKEKRKKLQRRTQFNSQDFPMFNASAKRAAAAKANTHQVFFLSTSEQISYEIPQSLPHFFISLEKRSHWRMFHCRNGFKCNLNEPHICLPFFSASHYILFSLSAAQTHNAHLQSAFHEAPCSPPDWCVWKRAREGGGVAVENRNLLLWFPSLLCTPSFALTLSLSLLFILHPTSLQGGAAVSIIVYECGWGGPEANWL